MGWVDYNYLNHSKQVVSQGILMYFGAPMYPCAMYITTEPENDLYRLFMPIPRVENAAIKLWFVSSLYPRALIATGAPASPFTLTAPANKTY